MKIFAGCSRQRDTDAGRHFSVWKLPSAGFANAMTSNPIAECGLSSLHVRTLSSSSYAFTDLWRPRRDFTGCHFAFFLLAWL